jgi:ABC-type Mn2+/Zn2+ transport system ATPase subunit
VRSDSNEALVEIAGASFGYGRKRVLSGVNLRIARGDFVGLVGPNGVGKTTLVRAILGTLKPRAGTLVYGGGVRPRFGYVPQRGQLDTLYPLTTRDIVLMARLSHGALHRFGAGDRTAAEEALASVGLADRAGVLYRDLSGGLKQRALIARALASEPEALALDEPTDGLDLLSGHAVRELVRDLHARRGLTVILVSHALDEVAATVRSLILIESGGRMEVGPREEVLTADHLSRLYGAPIRVGKALGRVVIAPANGEREP